jgi:uncharacterized Fe-S cluster protein YjdI
MGPSGATLAEDAGAVIGFAVCTAESVGRVEPSRAMVCASPDVTLEAAMPIEKHTNGSITVSYDSDVCTHAGRCVKGLPAVFDVKRKPWIDPDGASAEEVEAQVARCPSGALKFSRD